MPTLLPLLTLLAFGRASDTDLASGVDALQTAAALRSDDPVQLAHDRAAVVAAACSKMAGCARGCAGSLDAYAHVAPADRAATLSDCADFDSARDRDHEAWVLHRLYGFMEKERGRLGAARAKQLDCSAWTLGMTASKEARAACPASPAPATKQALPSFLLHRNKWPDGGVMASPKPAVKE